MSNFMKMQDAAIAIERISEGAFEIRSDPVGLPTLHSTDDSARLGLRMKTSVDVGSERYNFSFEPFMSEGSSVMSVADVECLEIEAWRMRSMLHEVGTQEISLTEGELERFSGWLANRETMQMAPMELQ